MQISIGDSTRGYESALVKRGKTGKYRLVPGTVCGREAVIRRIIANVNRGTMSYTTSAGDELSITLR